jgi:hypothetical protein
MFNVIKVQLCWKFLDYSLSYTFQIRAISLSSAKNTIRFSSVQKNRDSWVGIALGFLIFPYAFFRRRNFFLLMDPLDIW